MTLEEFNGPMWTGGLKLNYYGRELDVISVDFETKEVLLEENNTQIIADYTEVELTKQDFSEPDMETVEQECRRW